MTLEPTPAAIHRDAWRDIWDIAFWQALSDEHTPFAGGVALRQPRAPLLLANAVWQPDADAVADIRAFYAPHNIHAGVVTTQLEPSLVANLHAAGFVPEMRFTLSPSDHAENTSPASQPDIQPHIQVEQVSWTEAGRMGGVLAMAYDYLTFDTALGMLVARAMQRLTDVQAYLAFADNTPSGAMVVMPRADSLRAIFLGGKPDAKDTLTARLATDANRQDKHAEVIQYQPVQHGQLEPHPSDNVSDNMSDLIYWRQPT